MLYEHRNYYILPGKFAEWTKQFNEETVPIYKRLGGKLVGRAIVGLTLPFATFVRSKALPGMHWSGRP